MAPPPFPRTKIFSISCSFLENLTKLYAGAPGNTTILFPEGGKEVCQPDIVGGREGRGAWLGGMRGRGCAWGASVAGGGMHDRRDGHCSGRYASYWNTFLWPINWTGGGGPPPLGPTNALTILGLS